MRFIRAEAEDIALIATLAREIWPQHFIPIIGEKQVNYMLGKFQSEQAIRTQIKNGFVYYLLYPDQEPMGYLCFKQESAETLFLSKIYIHQKAQGQGMGREALSFVEEHARKMGLTQIRLTVNIHNHSAIAVYLKSGWKDAGEHITDIGNGFIMDDREMIKDLTDT